MFRLVIGLATDGVPVQVADVVAVEVAVGGQLPVRAGDGGGHPVGVQLVEAKGGEGLVEAGQPRVEVERGRRVEAREDRADALLGGQLDEPGGADLAEGVLPRHADQRATRVVAPRVVGAGEAAGAAAVLLGEPGPAVAADVEEGADLPVVASHDDDRAGGQVVGEEVARLAHVARQRHQQWDLQEDPLHLQLVLGRIGVARGRHLHRCVGHVGQPGADVGLQPLDDVVQGDSHRAPPAQRAAAWRPAR